MPTTTPTLTKPRPNARSRTMLVTKASTETHTATVSSVGQITIPRWARDFLGLEPGSKVEFTADPDTGSLTLQRQKTVKEALANLDEYHDKHPHPPLHPRYRDMSVGEMALELLKQPKKGDPDTWV